MSSMPYSGPSHSQLRAPALYSQSSLPLPRISFALVWDQAEPVQSTEPSSEPIEFVLPSSPPWDPTESLSDLDMLELDDYPDVISSEELDAEDEAALALRVSPKTSVSSALSLSRKAGMAYSECLSSKTYAESLSPGCSLCKHNIMKRICFFCRSKPTCNHGRIKRKCLECVEASCEPMKAGKSLIEQVSVGKSIYFDEKDTRQVQSPAPTSVDTCHNATPPTPLPEILLPPLLPIISPRRIAAKKTKWSPEHHFCPCGRKRFFCRNCNGGAYCSHGKIKWVCEICKAFHRVQFKRPSTRLVCFHAGYKRPRSLCDTCTLCFHDRNRYRCIACREDPRMLLSCAHKSERRLCYICNRSGGAYPAFPSYSRLLGCD